MVSILMDENEIEIDMKLSHASLVPKLDAGKCGVLERSFSLIVIAHSFPSPELQMSRKSKNTHTSAAFSYHERKNLDWGTKRERLSKDSGKGVLDCSLCLSVARSPLICVEGHLFCKECIYAHMIEQKQMIKKQSKAYEAQQAKLDQEREKVAGQAMQGSKRQKLDDSSVPKDRSFWDVNHIPSAGPELLKKPAKSCSCPAGHPLKLSELHPIDFQAESSSAKGEGEACELGASCPACLRTFTNAVDIVGVLPCHHAACQKCADLDSKCCVKCGVVVERRIRLESGTTGYASHGAVVSEKFDHAALV